MQSHWIILGCAAVLVAAMATTTSIDFAVESSASTHASADTSPASPAGKIAPLGRHASSLLDATALNSASGGRCQGDCLDGTAGYLWAEAHGIDDVEHCTSDSRPFNEGCVAYVDFHKAIYRHQDIPARYDPSDSNGASSSYSASHPR
jgi:hypothetical protein